MHDYPLNFHPDFTNLKQLIDHNAESSPDEVAFRHFVGDNIESVTYAEFKSDVDRLCAYFVSRGIAKSKIALISENSYQWLLTYFAVVLSGNIIVPLDKELSAADISKQLVRCEADILVCSQMYNDIGTEMLGSKVVKEIICIDDYPDLILQGKDYISMHPDYYINSFFEDEDACSIVFTSGTTGYSKGVMLSQKGIILDAVSACRHVLLQGGRTSDPAFAPHVCFYGGSIDAHDLSPASMYQSRFALSKR